MTEKPLGDDIRNLRALAITLCGYLPEITSVTKTLNQEVSQLTGGDPGWRGPAAAAFAAAWRRDADAAEALAVVISQTAGVVGDLATELGAIQTALEQEAHAAAGYGVKVGTDGRPPPAPSGAPASAAEASERHWAQAYRRAYQRAMADAQQARTQAARRLKELCATLVLGPEPAGTAAGPPDREFLPLPYRPGKAEPDPSGCPYRGCMPGSRGRHRRSSGPSVVAYGDDGRMPTGVPACPGGGRARPGSGEVGRAKAAIIVALDDKSATGQLTAAYRVPQARAHDGTSRPAPPDRERYAWLYDDEDIWAVPQDDMPPAAAPTRISHRRPG